MQGAPLKPILLQDDICVTEVSTMNDVLRVSHESGERVLSVLKAAGARLPSPGAVAVRVRELAAKENLGIGEIAEAVRADPALASQLLRLANAPARRGRRPIIDLGEAVNRLGLSVVEHLALAVTVLNGNRDGRCDAFDYDGFWRQSVAIAAGAQVAIGGLGGACPEELWVCGLLSRVGSLAYASAEPGRYAEAIRDAAGDVNVLMEQEKEVFGASHLGLGSAMLAGWGLPEAMTVAVGGMYDPQTLVGCDHRMRKIAWALHGGWKLASEAGDEAHAYAEALCRAGLDQSEAEAAVLDAEELRTEYEATLGLDGGVKGSAPGVAR